MNGTEIDIQPKTLNSGAQYLLFQKPYKDEKKVCCAYPDKELVLEKKLSDQIIDLMKFLQVVLSYMKKIQHAMTIGLS